MARCIAHEACPECRKNGRDRKGDNLAIYDDGSIYCFSCGFSPRGYLPNRNTRQSASISNKTKSISRRQWHISFNKTVYPVTGIGLSWLDKYYISSVQIKENNIQWCQEEKALYFPFFDDKTLVFYQLRYFDKQPKWKSVGPKPLIYKGSGRRVVLVEDIISAIRVGEVETSVPLFGSTCSTEYLFKIREKFDSIIIWLDYDKANAKETKKLKAKCKAIFKEVNQIITIEDPKAQTTDEIKFRINLLDKLV